MSVPTSATIRGDTSIRSNTQRTGRRWWLAVSVLASAGAVLVLVSTAKYGAGISYDSVWYLDVARNFVAGRGLVFHTGGHWPFWPPLYPVLLALVGVAVRVDPSMFAQFANAVLFGLVIFLSALLFRPGPRRTTTYSVLGMCAVLFSRPLSGVYAFAWSETLFIPLVLLYLVLAQRYWKNSSMLSLAAMILPAALACLTRYIGIAIVPAGILTVVLASGVRFRTRVVRAFAFAALSLLPVGLWLWRNHELTGTYTGARDPSALSFMQQVIRLANTISLWYAPGRASLFVLLGCAVLLLIVVLLSRLVRARLIAGVKAVFSDLSPAVLLLVSYACVLLAAAVTGASDPIGQRLLSPIYVPVTLVLLTLGYCSVVPAHAPANAVASRVAAILLALWLCYPLAFVAQSSIHNIRDGAGDYSTRAWRGSETIAYSRRVLSNESNVRVYSNGAMALWELARVNANEMPDRKSANLSDLAGHWPAVDGSVLVWFENPAWRRDFSIEELGRIARVEEVAHFGDGSVYRVWRRGTAVDEPDIGNIGGAASAPPAGP